MALLAEDIPDHRRIGLQCMILYPQQGGPFRDLRIGPARLTDPGKVAFDVRQEDRHPRSGKPFRQNLKRDGLAGTGRSRDQSMPVGVFQQERLSLSPTLAHEDRITSRHAAAPQFRFRRM